jgi:hypothetical protein
MKVVEITDTNIPLVDKIEYLFHENTATLNINGEEIKTSKCDIEEFELMTNNLISLLNG